MLDDEAWPADGIINHARGVSCASSLDFHVMHNKLGKSILLDLFLRTWILSS